MMRVPADFFKASLSFVLFRSFFPAGLSFARHVCGDGGAAAGCDVEGAFDVGHLRPALCLGHVGGTVRARTGRQAAGKAGHGNNTKESQKGPE